MIETRLLVDANNHLGEGPLWDVKEQRLYWIDSTAAEIYRCRADGSHVERFFVPTHIGSMALCEHGGAAVSSRARWPMTSTATTPIAASARHAAADSISSARTASSRASIAASAART